jgi:hypothetical protein
MKNKPETTPEERVETKVEKHFGGKHRTIHYSDGTTCNVYEDGYKSNSELVVKNFSPEIKPKKMKTKNTGNTDKNKAKSKTKPSKMELIATVEETTPVVAAPTPTKLSKADIKAAVENFLKNPPDLPLTLEQVYETIGFAHRQVYLMVREHGVPVGKTDKVGKGRKETLFTFKQ